MSATDLDNDTREHGTEPPFRDWEGDLTALVHVLWHAKSRGMTLADDADSIAALILRSRWLACQKHYAARGVSGG